MNWLDIVIAFFLLIAFIDGYRKGLIMQLVILAGVLIAVIFSGKLAAVIQPTLERISNFTPETLHVASYILAFIAIAIVAILVGRLIETIINVIFLGFFNRLLGSVVAMATTLVVFSLAINLLLILDTNEQIFNERTRSESFFFERVEVVVPAIVPYLNQELWERHLPELKREEVVEESSL